MACSGTALPLFYLTVVMGWDCIWKWAYKGPSFVPRMVYEYRQRWNDTDRENPKNSRKPWPLQGGDMIYFERSVATLTATNAIVTSHLSFEVVFIICHNLYKQGVIICVNFTNDSIHIKLRCYNLGQQFFPACSVTVHRAGRGDDLKCDVIN
jgi:hypothetical protein